jgi:hypothetical protein
MKRYGNRLRNLLGWGLLTTSLVLLAERHASPVTPAPNAAPQTVLAAGGNEGGGKKARAAEGEDKKMPDVVASFWRDHSRHKWEAFQKLPDAAQAQLRGQFITRYNELNKLATNSKLHEIELDRIRIEDNIFFELSKRKVQHPQGEKLPDDYVNAVRELIQNRMAERATRLAILQGEVDDDVQLAKDNRKFEEFVQNRAKGIERTGLVGGAAAQAVRRRLLGQPATSEPEEGVTPANP